MYSPAVSSVTITEARATLPDLIERVLAGEEVTLTRHGIPVVVMVHPNALRARRADRILAVAGQVRETLERGRRTPLASAPTLDPGRADEMIAELRAHRADR